jgi:hypothetical protein
MKDQRTREGVIIKTIRGSKHKYDGASQIGESFIFNHKQRRNMSRAVELGMKYGKSKSTITRTDETFESHL